jgi:hypothetical protein
MPGHTWTDTALPGAKVSEYRMTLADFNDPLQAGRGHPSWATM